MGCRGSQENPQLSSTRAGFLKYSCKITLDPNTAHTQLLLSEGNRNATFMSHQQSYSSHPDRFTDFSQVLSRESLTGRCYWEVKRRGGGVSIAVAYKNISRTGRSNESVFGRNDKSWALDRFQNSSTFWCDKVEWSGRRVHVAVAYKNISRAGRLDECRFGLNDKSWALYLNNHSYTFSYNSVHTPVSGPLSSRVGVYLDHSAGILSFYSVSETMTLLHRVQTTFTQPLYAGFWVYYIGDSAELCKLK
uniref:B30.2/SPRY domain-containing protein n=1 Tax=Sander lucioperca TaxID=283035 RepID=A0A8C9Z9P8_SANLU